MAVKIVECATVEIGDYLLVDGKIRHIIQDGCRTKTIGEDGFVVGSYVDIDEMMSDLKRIYDSVQIVKRGQVDVTIYLY